MNCIGRWLTDWVDSPLLICTEFALSRGKTPRLPAYHHAKPGLPTD